MLTVRAVYVESTRKQPETEVYDDEDFVRAYESFCSHRHNESVYSVVLLGQHLNNTIKGLTPSRL